MVHQYKLNGYNIVLDTCSGSVHVMDDIAYDITAMYKEHSAEKIKKYILDKYSAENICEKDVDDCLDDIKALESAGKLFTPDTYEYMAFDFKKRNSVIKALCLHVAHSCNLNCEFCKSG